MHTYDFCRHISFPVSFWILKVNENCTVVCNEYMYHVLKLKTIANISNRILNQDLLHRFQPPPFPKISYLDNS